MYIQKAKPIRYFSERKVKMSKSKNREERLGFLRTDTDISYFIIYVMTLLPGPISYSDLLDICLIDEAFGYFELQIQLDRLVESGVIFKDENTNPPLYFATKTCYDNADGVKMALPPSVIDKAQAAVDRVLKKVRRQSSLFTEKVDLKDGTFNVVLAIMAGERSVFKMEIVMENERSAELVMENFRNNAEYYYREYINMLLDTPKDEE